MLLSMTGFGDARRQDEQMTVAVEVRTVNNRYLKISVKCPDVYASLEGEIERVVRERIGRGTVTVSVRVDRHGAAEDFQVNRQALEAYWSQLQTLAQAIKAPHPSDLTQLLLLPGVIADDAQRALDLDREWQAMQPVLRESLETLQAFRVDEGRAMGQELAANVGTIAQQLERVAGLAPQVVSEFRTKMLERVRQVLAEGNVGVTEADLIREVSIYADRSDINEEITRMRCHLEQFTAFLEEKTSTGRKLEFLSQEMFREANTIGSKANNVSIAHAVVEMKAAIEKIREILQNVE